MAAQAISGSAATLRAITFRISSTPTAQLPQQVSAISASLPHCKAMLSSSQTSSSKDASESSVITHKYKTQLSTLIQDRTFQGRWAAVVLIKSTIEVGGWEVLQKSGPWVRGLLAVLTKPDPPTSKRLSIITLTRIFLLTRDYPTLVREITTPSLPTFIQSCLHLASTNVSSALLQTILESFNQLVPRYPTVFRTYVTQMQQLITPLIAPTPSNQVARELLPSSYRSHVSSETSQAARQLWVHLHNSAPKSASSEEWQKSIANTIENSHKVASKVFRAIIEEWQSSSGVIQMANGHILENEVKDIELNSMGIPAWCGLYAGSERLISLLQLVKEYATTSTASYVSFRLGPVMDLLRRIFSLVVPSPEGTKDWQQNAKLNNQVSKDERESLWAVLPHIHIAAIEVQLALLERFGESLFSIISDIIDQIVWVYNAEKEVFGLRTASYTLLGKILRLSGPTLPKSSVESLKGMIHACCNDLLPQDATVTQAKVTPGPTKGNANNHQGSTNADSFLRSSTTPKTSPAAFAGLQGAAYALLPVLIIKLPQKYIPVSLRAKIDRTAILTQHKEAMIASVLNPLPSKNSGKPAASIMPLVARSFADNMDVETLIRPRMPVIKTGKGGSASDEEDEDDEDIVDEKDAAEEAAMDDLGKEDTVMEEVARDQDEIGNSEISTAYVSSDAVPQAAPGETIDRESTTSATNLAKRGHTEIPAALPSPKRPRLESPIEASELVQVRATTSLEAPWAADTGEVFSAPVPALLNNVALPREKAEDGDSDSNDDFGELVLGPDSEDEDEVK